MKTNLLDEISKWFAASGESALESSTQRMLNVQMMSFGEEWYQQFYMTFMAFAILVALVVLLIQVAIAVNSDEPAGEILEAVKGVFKTFLMAYALTIVVQMSMYVLNEVARFIANEMPKFFFPDYSVEGGWFTLIVQFKNLLDPSGLILMNTLGGVGGMLLEAQMILVQQSGYVIVALFVFFYAFRDMPAGEPLLAASRATLIATVATKFLVVLWLTGNRIAMIGTAATGRDAFIWVMIVSFIGALIGLGVFLMLLSDRRSKKRKKVKIDGGKLDSKYDSRGGSPANTINTTIKIDAPATYDTYNVSNHARLDKLAAASESTANSARLVALVAQGTGTAAAIVGKVAPHPGVKAAATAIGVASTAVAIKASMVSNAADKAADAARAAGNIHDDYIHHKETKRKGNS